MAGRSEGALKKEGEQKDRRRIETIEWRWSSFAALPIDHLYAVLRLRQMVFIVEQKCAYLDADGYDERALHLLGWGTLRADIRMLGAYARIFPPDVKYAEASIGRVLTHPELRGAGLGRMLMTEAIRLCEALAPGAAIRIGAQLYLEAFYAGFGFIRASETYDEDGIPHIEMLRMPV